MKRIVVALVLMMTLLLAACQNFGNSNKVEKMPKLKDRASLEEAGKLAGFDLIVPESMKDYTNVTVQAAKKKMIQVTYSDKDMSAAEKKTVVIRKAVENINISEDSKEYPERTLDQMNGIVVTTKGEGGLVNFAVWKKGGYVYSLYYDEAVPRETIEHYMHYIY